MELYFSNYSKQDMNFVNPIFIKNYVKINTSAPVGMSFLHDIVVCHEINRPLTYGVFSPNLLTSITHLNKGEWFYTEKHWSAKISVLIHS